MLKTSRLSTLLLLAGFLASGVHAQEWGPIHNLLIKFYGYQRAGASTGDTKNPFYKTSPFPHSTDSWQGKDLSGGWYDAGDFVKFGLPFGYTAYCLLKGYDVFPRGYDDLDSWDYKGAPDGIPDILGEVRIATDYMQKAVLSADAVVTDVGDAAKDHMQLDESGYANSQRTSPRTVYAQTGADIAGLYAASLALMSKLYKPHDAAYAAACLAKAREAFSFGLKNQKLSTQQGNSSFYKTKTFADKMACAAVELYRATGEEAFLTHARTFQSSTPSHFFVLGYANTGDLSAFELTRLGVDGFQTNWLTDVDLTMSRVVSGADAPELIRGAFIRSDWGNAGHAGSAAFSAALAFQITGDNAYREFAINQVKWVTGQTPFKQSYVVGLGNGPTAPHHRNDVALGKSGGVRLKGGIVSGPTPQGSFNEGNPGATAWTFNGSDASKYQNTEVALDYNAGAIGAVGFIRDYLNPPAGLIRIQQGVKAVPEIVNLNTQTVAITFTLEAAAPWKLVLEGRSSKAVKAYTGTGTAGAATWAGEADKGVFMAGESVDIRIENDKIAAYHLSRARGSFFLSALKKEEFRAGDVVLEDFEVADSANAAGGAWSIFTDKAAGGASYTSPAAFGPSVFVTGETGKGINLRLVGAAGAAHPSVGLRATFNAAGTPVSLGAATSVVFDLRSTAGSTLWVELEQPGIADGAYHAFTIPIGNDLWNRVRIPLSSFVQPAWRAAATALNPGSVTALRFSYNGVGTIRFDLDNVRIEGLKVGPAPTLSAQASLREPMVHGLRAGKEGLVYAFQPGTGKGLWTAEVLDMSGRVLGRRRLVWLGGTLQAGFPGLALGSGGYILRHRSAGHSTSEPFRIP